MKPANCNNDSENVTWQAAMRFSMVVLSSALFGMYYGQSLPPEIGQLCWSFALNGLAFYFSLELVADQRAHRRELRSRRTAEQSLSRRLQRERNVAAHVATEKGEQRTGTLESAMDSTADLAMFLGPTSQPVLSV